jgi:hypothetical protein
LLHAARGRRAGGKGAASDAAFDNLSWPRPVGRTVLVAEFCNHFAIT